MPAPLALFRAVVDAGGRVPCVVSPQVWTNPASRSDVAQAIVACGWCPVRDLCRSVAAEQQPHGVVQGGQWWGVAGPLDRAPRHVQSQS